jgi:hypothetical protein
LVISGPLVSEVDGGTAEVLEVSPTEILVLLGVEPEVERVFGLFPL